MLNVENRIQYMITFNSNVMIRNLFLLVVFLGCVSLRHVEAAIDIVPKPVKLVEPMAGSISLPPVPLW